MRFSIRMAALAMLAALCATAFSLRPEAVAQPAKDELPVGLQYVPADAAFFVYVDVAKVWNSNILQSIRKADAKTFDGLLAMAKAELGLAPEDLKSVVAFVPRFNGDRGRADSFGVGVVVTFNKAFDKDKLQKGAEKLLGIREKFAIKAINDRTAVVLMNLKDWYAEPQSVGETGPLTAALKEAASGKFAAVVGAYPAALPLDLDDGPQRENQPFLPLVDAQSLTATLELEKTPTLDVRVKARTSGQGVACEKALDAALRLIQSGLANAVKEGEKEAAKDAAVKDLLTLMNAAIDAAKAAKVTRLDRELRLTATLPGDLPYAAAALAARKKIQENAGRAASSNNVHQLGIAFANYASAFNGKMVSPIGVTPAPGAKPLLSWRVHLLPQLEADDLYRQFKLDEPWDSENNKKLIEKMPKFYASPYAPAEAGKTHYKVFVSDGAADMDRAVFDKQSGASFPATFADGTSNTIMVAEAGEAVIWTKPEDIPYDRKKPLPDLKVNGKTLILVGLADGSVRTIDLTKVSEKTLKSAIMPADGEPLGADW